jgi:transcription elongation GreA/GreB family factor
MAKDAFAKLSKSALQKELVALMARELDTSVQSQRTAQAASIHEEAKAEDDKDTRALELSYLARGQANRVTELHEALGAIEALKLGALREGDAITVGALVLVEDEEGDAQTLFLLPHGAGNKLAKGTVQIATLRSPLGEALLGRHIGDSVEVPRGTTVRELSILAVR